MSAITIPNKLKVGFKLEKVYGTEIANLISYITFFDEKTKKWNSEISWNKWIDPTIPVLEFDNIPRSGFILNHNVGGVNSGYSRWNTRTEKMRVFCSEFDNSQFEITLENLTFLMKNTSHVPGVGFDSECIFGFDGKKIFLIPTISVDYQEILKFTKISKEKIKSVKDLVEGGVYITNKNEKVIFLEYAPFYEANEIESNKNAIFIKDDSKYNPYQIFDLKNLKSLDSEISKEDLIKFKEELKSFKGYVPYKLDYRIEFNKILTLDKLKSTKKYSESYTVFMKEKNSLKEFVISQNCNMKQDENNFTVTVIGDKEYKQFKHYYEYSYTLFKLLSKGNIEIETCTNLEDFLKFELYSKDYIDQRTKFYEPYILNEIENKVYHINSSTNKKEALDLSHGRVVQNVHLQKEDGSYIQVYVNSYDENRFEIKDGIKYNFSKRKYILTEQFDDYGFGKKSIGDIAFDSKEEIFKHFQLYHLRLELLD